VVRPLLFAEPGRFAELLLEGPAQVHLSSLKRNEVKEPARFSVGLDFPQFLQI
jgi:hypothetical protein